MSRLGIIAGLLLFAACGPAELSSRAKQDEREPLGNAAKLPPVPDPSLPEIPAIDRDVVLIRDRKHNRPHIPPFKTTQDARLALNNNGKLFVFRPEALSDHALQGAAGTHITSEFGSFQVPLHAIINPLAKPFFMRNNVDMQPSVNMTAMCDATTNIPKAGQGRRNPYACGEDLTHDCYDVTIIATVLGGKEYKKWWVDAQVWGLPVTVEIADPKSAQARIVDVKTHNNKIQHTAKFTVQNMFEPVVTEDGRLLVTRVSNTDLTWPDDNKQLHSGGPYDTVYSVYDESLPPCQVSQWKTLWPITHAPFHQTMKKRYGFAKYQFRDPEGNLIPDGSRLKGTYPWIDRRGQNLFFSLIGEHLYYFDSQHKAQTRYPAACLPGVKCELNPTPAQYKAGDFQGGWHYQNMAVAGLWTHGKVVSLDGLMSHLDYPMYSTPDKQRMLRLFNPHTGPSDVANQSGWVQAGSGRAIHDRPTLTSGNGEMIESLEQLLNFSDKIRTRTPRDVVWIMSNGKATEEVVFDDFLDKDTLIYSNMRASLTHNDPADWNRGTMRYRDGFRLTKGKEWDHYGDGFVDPKRLQNGATSPLFGQLPKYGLLESEQGGKSRIEPMALGGIEGKGLWLDGLSRVTYTIDDDPSLRQRNWYVALFVDQRQNYQGDVAQLLTFPNGGEVLLHNAQYIGYRSPGGKKLFSKALPARITHQNKRWNHFAFALRNDGRSVDFYLNGMLFWSVNDSQPILQIQAGNLVVGKKSHPLGFRGWIDEFKVVGRIPNPEVACNHARGFVRGLGEDASQELIDMAELYPDAAHEYLSATLSQYGKPSFARYVCYHNYRDPDALPRDHKPDLGGKRLSENLLFPEGPFVWNQPRPDSRNNGFCVSCHDASFADGLSDQALYPGTVELIWDDRRQPFMWPLLQTGNFPANYFGPGIPADNVTLPDHGTQVFDMWLFQ